MKTRNRTLVLLGSLVAGVSIGFAVVGIASAAPTEVVTQVVPQATAGDVLTTPYKYPINAKGQTYGSEVYARTPDEAPDLILAIGNKGTEGYLLKSDLHPALPKTPEEAGAIQKANEARGDYEVPLYAADGVTIIDSFTIATGQPPK